MKTDFLKHTLFKLITYTTEIDKKEFVIDYVVLSTQKGKIAITIDSSGENLVLINYEELICDINKTKLAYRKKEYDFQKKIIYSQIQKSEIGEIFSMKLYLEKIEIQINIKRIGIDLKIINSPTHSSKPPF